MNAGCKQQKNKLGVQEHIPSSSFYIYYTNLRWEGQTGVCIGYALVTSAPLLASRGLIREISRPKPSRPSEHLAVAARRIRPWRERIRGSGVTKTWETSKVSKPQSVIYIKVSEVNETGTDKRNVHQNKRSPSPQSHVSPLLTSEVGFTSTFHWHVVLQGVWDRAGSTGLAGGIDVHMKKHTICHMF